MKIAILAVQGAFIEHEYMLEKLGAQCVELRKASDITDDIKGLVLPGGESTVQSKLLHDLDMFDKLQSMIDAGLPVLATCAGMILLSQEIAGDSAKHFATLPIRVLRNAYGRQLGSFSATGVVRGIQEEEKKYPLEFIRAPFIESILNDSVEAICEIEKKPMNKTGTIFSYEEEKETKNVIAVRYKNQLAFACHPELTEDTRVHQMFFDMCKEQ